MESNREKKDLLDKKLKEMADEGVMKKKAKVTLAFDPPCEEEFSSRGEENLSIPLERENMNSLSIEEYRSRYLHPVHIRERTSFTMNVETLQLLRYVLQDLNERLSLTSYIENILHEHLKTYQELLNTATAKQRRKTTITL